MITGIGIDSVMVSRIAEKIRKEDFKLKIFSANEIEYCEKNAHPAEHFAARFAVKEAFLKAIGSGLGISYELNQIEVSNKENGQPEIMLLGEFKTLEEKWNKVHVSLTHTDTIASAVVILEK
jgi:holo-[acyl-carrier protein] synthase